MNFFQHQAKAEQKTGRLVVLFLLAIVAIIVALYFVGVLALSIAASWTGAGAEGPRPGIWQPDLLVTVAVAAIAVIGLGSLFKIAALKAGGTAVASRLGGKRIVHETSDPLERQLINVVEEMSIASGLPCPAIYVMEREAAINAFAAGYTPNDAAVAVTRGCLEQLDRDELQGVIAHEFSHILNGDMRLNIRLIGILNGILVIGLLGYAALRISAYSSGSRSRQGGGVIMAIMAAGAGAMVIGYVGVVFGRLIKAAVSRQREYLADASAVAMTRHPKGLAGALSTISRFSTRGRLKARNAEEASHMFFANGLAPMALFANSMATHPPLAERIKRIDKHFDPKDHKPKRQREPQPKGKRKQPEAPTSEKILGMIGVLTADHIDRGTQMHDDMPEAIRLAAHDPLGAVTLSYALLLDEDADARKKQLATLGNPAIAEETERMRKHVDVLEPELLMPALDLALPALRGLGAERAEHFLADIKRLIESDDRLTVFEFALQTLLRHRLQTPRRVLHKTLTSMDGDIGALLSVLAGFGHDDPASAERAYQAGAAVWFRGREIPARRRAGPEDMSNALDRLAAASAPIKARTVEACATCILADQEVTDHESQLLRAVCAALDCPLPPLI